MGIIELMVWWLCLSFGVAAVFGGMARVGAGN